ncbi:MAG: NAD-dependent epimerase/dehydratase family protein [Desulfobacula sp.]|jgi:UDP-glucose 4-epimerase|nr:NAD-dependent epimerase/dehydratase family protein [Desulfobacula sp.]
MGLKWLITGGCGFIGRNLVKNLIDEGGHYIRIVDNLSVGTKHDLSQVCRFNEISGQNYSFDTSCAIVDLIVGDILDVDLAVKITKNIDVIVHLAANTGVGPSVENPRKDCETNIIGTLNYLEAARSNSVNRFVFASSGAPAGECEPPIHEELPAHPVSPYGASKLAGEGYCSSYFRTFGIETVALRFGNVYGPLSSNKDSAVARFIKKILNNETLEIYGDGNQTRDFIYIQDLINAIRLATDTKAIGGEIFQIATARETTINEIVQLLSSFFSGKGVENISIKKVDPRLGDVKRNFSDTTKAKQFLGWYANTVLSEGLAVTTEWFIDQNSKK